MSNAVTVLLGLGVTLWAVLSHEVLGKLATNHNRTTLRD